MNDKPADETIAIVEVGSATVTVIIGKETSEGIHVFAYGANESQGLRNGEVRSPAHVAQSMANAIEEAEIMAGGSIEKVHTAIGGAHCFGRRTTGTVPVIERTVSRADMNAAIDAAVAGQVREGFVLQHKLVREWVVDGREGISRPEGMPARRLEVRMYLVMARKSAVRAIEQCIEMCGKQVAGVYLDALAASEAVLTDVEKERGCVMVDIGAQVTDIAIWSDGALVHNVVIPVGGEEMTGQVGTTFRVPRATAERMKRRHGAALVSAVNPDEMFTVPSEGNQPSKKQPRQLMATVLEPTMNEIFQLVRREVELTGYEDALGAGFVLTGGVSTMPAAREVAERRLKGPVRVGHPAVDGSLVGMVDMVRHPRHSVSVGLLKLACDRTMVEPGFDEPPTGFAWAWSKMWGYIRRML